MDEQPKKQGGPITSLAAIWIKISTLHCRGLLLGGIIGLVASPVSITVIRIVGLHAGLWSFDSELGPYPIAITEGFLGAPVVSLLGASVGSAVDFFRERDRFSFVALVCTTMITGIAVGVLALGFMVRIGPA